MDVVFSFDTVTCAIRLNLIRLTELSVALKEQFEISKQLQKKLVEIIKIS